MDSIGEVTVPAAANAARWAKIAVRVDAWLATLGIARRDAIVLVPFVQLLPHARRAFAAHGGLMPRIETTRTLAASLAASAPVVAGGPTLDAATDALVARQMLAGLSWGAQWRRNDRRGFDRAAMRLVGATHEVVRALSTFAPAARDEAWHAVRTSLGTPSGPGARERALARLAVEWAALAVAAPTDRLFALQPGAWISVRAGGRDGLVDSLFAAASAPRLVVDTDACLRDAPGLDAAAAPAYAECAGFEQEAEAAADQVLLHLGRGERPVALLAVDRVAVRRVRALLERSGAAILDETGWKLSTTRAAAAVMALLLAADADAGTDQLLAWLKSGFGNSRDGVARQVAALEALCRKQAIWRIDALARTTLDHDEAEAARRAALAQIAPLQGAAPRPLTGWRDALMQVLDASGALGELEADEAGSQMLRVLGAGLAAGTEPLPLAAFVQWVDEAMEDAAFRPSVVEGDVDRDDPDVVITPLARAMLRPFAAAVLPGADDRHLGAHASADSLLSSATREALGMATAAKRRQAEWLAFLHVLALPQVTLLRRRSDGSEPLAASPFVERLSLALAAQDRRLRPWTEPGALQAVESEPTRRAGVVAPTRLPARLSATSYEALRACPYRFFATRMLRVKEDAELDGDLEKRDYGSWLHEVLLVFHEARPHPAERRDDDEAALRSAADRVLAASGFDAAEFLPWRSAFDAFVPRYASWLRAREARGARWRRGEAEFLVSPPALGGVELHGVIDRIDEVGEGSAATIELIDYKTGSKESLRERVADRFEDTQLAFYAALVAADGRPVKATYLPLDMRPELKEVAHADVARSAVALVAGIAIDLSRIRSGAAMMPLGEGDACRYCEARGLCRRDHWSE